MLQKVLIVSLASLTLLSFSCSPKAAGVRATVKTPQDLNPAVSTSSQQQAALQGVNYQIKTISVPVDVTGGQEVKVELITPSNEYLPLKTQHINGIQGAQGTYEDKARGLQVYLESRCSEDGCKKYVLLVTVSKNNQRVFQTGAISFKDDCQFLSMSASSSTTGLFANLDAFEGRYNVTPKNDIDSCQN